MLTEEQGKQLLGLARESIESYFSKKSVDLEPYRKFSDKQGVFVTLHKHGELRGCIGFPHPTRKLCDAVHDAARAAAFDDPRFPKLEQDELKDIDIELSVLTVPEEIKAENPKGYLENIEISDNGDGLIIKSVFGSGLLLPQVFTEYKCTPEQALEMTCQKAGLPPDAWQHESTQVFRFQAQIFKEKE